MPTLRQTQLYNDAMERLHELFDEFESGNIKTHRDISNLLYQLAVSEGRDVGLMMQLGITDTVTSFIGDMDRDNRLPEFGLLMVYVGDAWDSTRARLGDADQKAFKLKKWLSDPVIRLRAGKTVFTRRDVIRTVRNKDGGAHSDVTLAGVEEYEYHREISAAMWTAEINGQKRAVHIRNAFAHSLHQMAYELLVTAGRLSPYKRKFDLPCVIVADAMFREARVGDKNVVQAPPGAASAQIIISAQTKAKSGR